MKRYVFPVAAAASVALGVAGGALAGAKPAGHPAKAHVHVVARPHVTTSLVPSVTTEPRAWLKGALEKTKKAQKAQKAQKATQVKKAKKAKKAKTASRRPKQATRKLVPVRSVERRRGTTLGSRSPPGGCSGRRDR